MVSMVCTVGAIGIAHALDVVQETHLHASGVLGYLIGNPGPLEDIVDPESQISKLLEDLVQG